MKNRRVLPTSRDVARLAGVSQATVSHVFTGRGSVSTATRERVRDIAASIGYAPDLAARSMRTGRSARIGVLTGASAGQHLRVLAGITEVATASGFTVNVQMVSGSTAERTKQMLALATDGRHEGLLALVPVDLPPHAIEQAGIPIIAEPAFDTHMRSLGVFADATPVAHLVDRLVAAGHSRFVHIAGSNDFASARARETAFLTAVSRHNVRSFGVLGGDWSAESARLAILSLPESAIPVAVIAANDVLAVGVLRAAHERGWAVPDDLVVTGWDNTDIAEHLVPSLTSVVVDFEAAGRATMSALIAAIRGEEPTTQQPVVNRIIWRESTGDIA